ncbi:MAG TPA: hypothetical protein VGK40_08655, partial [Verrucomicrobiae bacterium]
GVLLYRHSTAIKEKARDEGRVIYFSNQLERVKTTLDEQEQINVTQSSNVTARSQEALAFSNNVNKLSGDLAKTRQEAKAAAEAAAAQLAEEKAKIAKLESERDDLTRKMVALNTSISGLEQQIAATEAKLSTAEGDKEFLFKELKQLQAAKADLERQFNDLALLRQQVSKLREEISIARRLEWIRQGILGVTPQKGAEKLVALTPPAPPKTNYGLNVELRQEGGAVILPVPVIPSPVPVPVPTPPK